MKIKVSLIMAILLFHIIFINIYYISFYNYIVLIFSLILILYLIPKIKIFLNEKYKKINTLLLCYCGIIIISSFYNYINVQWGIFYVIKLINLFLFFEYIHQKKEEKNIIRIFTFLTFAYVLLNDFIMILRPDLFYVYDLNYLLGNKFPISYLHLVLVVLYIYNKENDSSIYYKFITILFYILGIVVSIFTECTTGLIGFIIFPIIYLFNKNKKKKINAELFILTLIISCTILLIFSSIIKLKPIEYIITNILHEDITLTGRTDIYENVFYVINDKWLLGYGYGNSYDVMFKEVGYANTQNALLEYWIMTGFLGMVLLILLIYKIIKNYNQNMNSIIACLYVFIILGSVEITICLTFFGLLAIINNGESEKNQIANRKEERIRCQTD